MTLENQALHLENERLTTEVAFLRSQLTATQQVLIDRGLDEGPHAGLVPARVERAIAGVAREATERFAVLQAENARLTAKCNRMVRSASITDIHGGRA